MRSVLKEIDARGAAFAQHTFFTRLAENQRLEDIIAFGPGLTFWALAFQDLLRINESFVSDPFAREIVRQHRTEDLGHDQWFLHDMKTLGQVRDLGWVFGPEHVETRDAAYSLVSEVFRGTSDWVRVALLIVLETTGSAFFTRVADCVERTGYTGRLKYLSPHHLAAERDHEIWERTTQAELATITLPAPVRTEALAMVGRAFTAFERLLDHLDKLTTDIMPEHRAGDVRPRLVGKP